MQNKRSLGSQISGWWLGVVLLARESDQARVVLDESADQLLENVRAAVLADRLDVLPIPDMKGRGLDGLVGAHCSGGTVAALSSLTRTGECSVLVERGGSEAVVVSRLGLGRPNITFARCVVNVGSVRHSSPVTFLADPHNNSFYIKMRAVKVEDKCKARLEEVRVEYLKGLRVVTGCGVLHDLEDYFLSWILRHIQKKVVSHLYDKAYSVAKSTLTHVDLCPLDPVHT